MMLCVGFDDTDSPVGMCTTYLAYLIAKKFCMPADESNAYTKHGNVASDNIPPDASSDTHVSFLDYPQLVRFNPNVPWKTRGNGAVSLFLQTDNPDYVKDVIKDMVFSHADIKNGANPGLVFFKGHASTYDDIAKFSELALWQLVSRADAKRFAQRHGLEYHYRGNGQGLVGSIGAIGYRWNDDHTLELLSYRRSQMCGTPRVINTASVKKMQRLTIPHTFNNYDEKKNRVLITPRGPDPVFYGIRGENASSIIDASHMIQSSETPQGYMIFRTNQGTGAHLNNELTIQHLKPYASGWVSGVVVDAPPPNEMRGGHVFFDLFVASSNIVVHCAVYKPTKLTRVARHLIKGDLLRVGGGIRKASKNHARVLNVEYINIIKLVPHTYLANPTCQACNKSMKSKGVGQGFECIRCKRRADSKAVLQRPRPVRQGLYIPDAGAQRHLTRPRQRQNVRNCNVSFDNHTSWLCVYKK